MRILYLRYGPQSGVAEAVVSRLRAAGHEVHVFDPVDGFLYKRRLGGLKVPNLAPEPVLATAAAMARFGRHWKPWYVHTTWAFDRLSARCERALDDVRPDVVLQAGVLFAPGRRRRTRTFLYCDHTRALNEAYAPLPGLDPPIPFEEGWRRREADVYLGAERIFTMSEHVKRSLAVHYGVDPGRVTVVGAGPNVEPARGAALARRPEVLLFVGHPFVPKGGPEALQAFAAVRAHHPQAELWMVGGQQPPRAPAGVKLLGRLSPPEVARCYERAGAFVLPTLREAFGLSFLEAMSFGLPCVATAIEAIPEIVVHGETGLLVPPRDPAAVRDAMLALLGSPERARAMGEAGRARVAERFGWDRAVRRMLDAMESGARRARPLAAEDRAIGGARFPSSPEPGRDVGREEQAAPGGAP